MAKTVEFKGDKKIAKRLKKFQEAEQLYKGYDVGFFKGARYQPKQLRKCATKSTNTHPKSHAKKPGPFVSEVAFWNEFGTDDGARIPARPFFQIGNKKAQPLLIHKMDRVLKAEKSYVLSFEDMQELGLLHVRAVQQEITDLQQPPNKPRTIKLKCGAENPLIDTGFMRASVTTRVVK